MDQRTLPDLARLALALQTLHAFLESQDHSIRFGFSSEAGHLCSQATRLRVADVESHGVDVCRHSCFSVARGSSAS